MLYFNQRELERPRGAVTITQKSRPMEPVTADPTRAREPSSVLDDPAGVFHANYNRTSFLFAHGLADSPLFELESLIELADRMPDHRETYWANGRSKVASGWNGDVSKRYSLRDTIANIAENDSMVILKHTEQDPVYASALQGFLTRTIDLCGERMRADATVGEALILISSPNRITPYHFDAETNFLVQVRGSKVFYVFDRAKGTVVSDQELEAYFAGNISSAVYQPHLQTQSTAYDLHAGWGVHVPTATPHWVQNKDNVSVAISINYELRSVYSLARLHRMNGRLRKLGLRPATPGLHPWRDRLKLAAARGGFAVRSLLKRRSSPGYALWTPQ